MSPLITILLAVAAVLIAILVWRPYLLGRILLVIFVRLFYRMRVFGAENIPQRGGALFVCNHVSYIDWVLLLVAQKRFIRFVLFAGWTRILFIRHILRWGRAIPIDAASGPKAILKSLRTGGDALAQGDLVCIFAEGRFTRTGFLLPFHRGFEQLVKNTDAPIIPVCLDELWGSVFSFYGDRTLWKWPRMVPYPVSVAFGKPMPATSSAAEVRLAVQKLSADCAIARTEGCRSLPREFVRTAAHRPWATCVIEAAGDSSERKSQTYSYSTVLAQAMCLAWALRTRLDTQPVVGIWLPPGVQATIAHLAVAFCGKGVVHLDATSSPDRLRSIIAQSNVTHVLSSSALLGQGQTEAKMPELIDVDAILKAVRRGRKLLAKFCATLMPGFVTERWILKLQKQQLDDLAAVVFGGSGDDSKGIRISHRNLVASVSAITKTFDLVSRDRVMGTLPPADCTGYTFTLWAPLSIGMSVVYVDSTHPEEIGRACQAHRCTVWPTTPGQLTVACQSESDIFRSLRTLVVVGDKFSEESIKDLHARLGILPLAAYARAELASIAATNVPNKTLENFTQVGNKPGTVGQPLPGIAARIVDSNTLEPVPAGQEGVLVVCGPNVMQGYLGRDEETRQVIRDGWFVTGDRAAMDEEGFITIK
jgi:acyl-[acyl-carrier-protein]-phospholipid O-acyltransferase / long-chain-fatty-acid--[acyl-carrier-protein] ligase